jgi:hypothetical protein
MRPVNRPFVPAAIIAIPLVAGAILFAACTGSNEASSAGPVPTVAKSTPSKPESETATTAVVETAPTTEATDTGVPPTIPKPPLEDGRHFGYIKSVDLGPAPATLSFDLAYLLKGDEANEEAARRGYPTPVDNDYFIVDDNPKLRTLVLSDDVELRLLDWKHCCTTFFPGELGRFAASFERKKYPAGNYKGKFSAYELTVAGGEVVAIDEHFFP